LMPIVADGPVFGNIGPHGGPVPPQFANNVNVSPITPPEVTIPPFTMEPSIIETNRLQVPAAQVPADPGSKFGTIIGFTHRGWTGVIVVVVAGSGEGLNASAVAEALMEELLCPQIREKKPGSAERVTCTVMRGFTPVGPAHDSAEQSTPDPPPAVEYVTVITSAAVPATTFWEATAVAA
jgi:hypothetical protein